MKVLHNIERVDKPTANYTMIILTENDIKRKCNRMCGFGYEYVIMPDKYRDVSNSYLDCIRHVAKSRGGEIIYI